MTARRTTVDLTAYEDLKDLGMMTAANLAVAYDFDDDALAGVHKHIRKELADTLQMGARLEEEHQTLVDRKYVAPAKEAVARAQEAYNLARIDFDVWCGEHPELDEWRAWLNPALASARGTRQRLWQRVESTEQALMKAKEKKRKARRSKSKDVEVAGLAEARVKILTLEYLASVAWDARRIAKQRNLEARAFALSSSV